MAGFQIKLLGPIQVERDGRPVGGFRSQKALALLGYLAAEGRPVSRTRLAGLFWGDAPEGQARGELRRVLHNLSQRLPGCLEADRRTVEFRAGPGCRTDLAAFVELQADETPAALAEAAGLYRGEFLEGLFLDDCPEVETWLLTERERWRGQAVQVLQTLIAHHAGQGQAERGLEFAARLLALEPWREETHRQMMLLLARSGQRSAALAQYETCRQVLAEELDVEPTPETTALYERIKAAVAPRPHNLPSPPTPFVGRQAELGQVTGLLAGPDCRLLTLTGPGGIGKTRLALQAARKLVGDPTGLFWHGVYFVPLMPLQASGSLVPLIAEALRLSLSPAEDGKRQLLDYLSQKEILLILDNCEAVLARTPSPAVNLIAGILAAAPQVKILATSRQALNLQGEWRLRLEGLAYPPAWPPPPTASVEPLSAVRLFAQSARRARPDFSLETEAPAVARICQLVEGMPLALELAAGWLKALSAAEIAREIEGGLDILAASQPNLPQRHRSLRAVFESSWARLTVDEREVLARLAVFRGGFSRRAAENVALSEASGPGLALLARLVDKSLLATSRSAVGPEPAASRYDLHDLLRQFVAEKLGALPASGRAEAFGRHSRYFASFVQDFETRLQGAKRTEALAALELDMQNVQASWRWAVEQGMWDVVEIFLNGLFLFHELRGWFSEGEAIFSRAAQSLEPDADIERRGDRESLKSKAQNPKANLLLGRVLARRGWFCWRLGRYEEAKSLAGTGLTGARQTEDRREMAFGLRLLGLVAAAIGDFAEARERFQASLALWRELDDRRGTALTLFDLGRVYQALGQYQQAGQPYREGLAIFKEAGYQPGATTAFGALGRVVRSLGEYSQARRLCQESLALHRELENPWGIAAALDSLGAIDCGLGQYDQARESFQVSLAARRQLDDPRGVAAALDNLGQVAYLQEKYEEARRLCAESLAIRRELGDRPGQAQMLHNLGHVALLEAAYREAERFCWESLALYRALGDRAGLAGVSSSLGYIAVAQGDDAGAQAQFEEAFDLAVAIQAAPIALDALLGRATLLARQGEDKRVKALLALVLGHPAGTPALEAKARRLLPEQAGQLPMESATAAKAVGQVDELESLKSFMRG